MIENYCISTVLMDIYFTPHMVVAVAVVGRIHGLGQEGRGGWAIIGLEQKWGIMNIQGRRACLIAGSTDPW